MKLWHGPALAVLSLLALGSAARAEDDYAPPPPVADLTPATPPSAADAGPSAHEPAAIESPLAPLIRDRLAEQPADLGEYELKERAALAAFYDARKGKPLWVSESGLNDRAAAVIAALARADDWGLVASDFKPPRLPPSDAVSPRVLADAEVTLSLVALQYGRYARGGRIMDPTTQLSSYLDRKPQLVEPKTILANLAASDDPGAALEDLHPKHKQFQLLRQKYLELRAGTRPAKPATTRAGHAKAPSLGHEARRVLANMEEWRWMPADMGDLYVWNNIPEYLTRVVKAGDIIHTERIVAGLVSKQTPIFSRPMRRIVFRPKWRVPESIMVRELWPSMLRGGGLMYKFGLQVETPEGQPVDWKRMDWTKEDIRKYHVVQPPGPHNLLGLVKFAFPSQHTVYMHDTPDKYMFAATQRTYSHGCMRVKNPVEYAKVILKEANGLDAGKIDEFVKSGPLDNKIELDRRVPVHITYFTAFISGDGQLHTFPDVYGHERKISLALEGKWSQISVGRNHLDPVDPATVVRTPVAAARPEGETPAAPGPYGGYGKQPNGKQKATAPGGGGLFSAIFGGGL